MPNIIIYDLSKQKVNGNYITITSLNNQPFTFNKLNTTIKIGSLCLDIDDMSLFCISTYGLSLPSVCTLLLIKLLNKYRPIVNDFFAEELNMGFNDLKE